MPFKHPRGINSVSQKNIGLFLPETCDMAPCLTELGTWIPTLSYLALLCGQDSGHFLLEVSNCLGLKGPAVPDKGLGTHAMIIK